VSITGSASIVDGSDGDANQETIEIEVAPIDFLPALKGEDSRVGSPDGGEITVSFDSDENLVDIEADVRGPEDGTVTEEDFSGDRNDGYEVTYEPDSDGDYIVELVTAEDADGNDGAAAEEYADETTVETEDDTGTEEPTEEPTSESTEQTTTDDDGVETELPTGTQPGFGSVVALVALLASALLFYRRQ